jgi:hypothetical protein
MQNVGTAKELLSFFTLFWLKIDVLSAKAPICFQNEIKPSRCSYQILTYCHFALFSSSLNPHLLPVNLQFVTRWQIIKAKC